MPDEVKITVESAVAAAAAEHGLSDKVEFENTETAKVETAKVESEETTEAKDSETENVPDVELDQRTLRALNILDQLEDAKGGPELVRQMAIQLGLLEGAHTQRQAEKTAQTFKDKVIAKLGSDYPILADSLGELFDQALAEQEQKFNHEIQVREKARFEAEVDAIVVKFVAENKVTEAEQAEISKLSSKFPPSYSVPPAEYLAHQLKVVRWEQAEAKEKSRTKEKVRENLANSPANRGVAGNEERIIKASKNLTPLQAVQMAARGESVDD
jgi:hypothetical protein